MRTAKADHTGRTGVLLVFSCCVCLPSYAVTQCMALILGKPNTSPAVIEHIMLETIDTFIHGETGAILNNFFTFSLFHMLLKYLEYMSLNK